MHRLTSPPQVQDVAIALGQWQVPAGRFPGLHELVGVDHERLAVAGQARAGTVAYEQRAAELAFELLDPGGDRRLGHVQLFGGRSEAAVADDFQEGAGEVDVHVQADAGEAGIVRAAAPPRYRALLDGLGLCCSRPRGDQAFWRAAGLVLEDETTALVGEAMAIVHHVMSHLCELTIAARLNR